MSESVDMRPQSPPFARETTGRPLIPIAPAALYGFGDLIRRCELLLLDLFRHNLVSGTIHTCLGQELCQMAVVRTLTEPHDAIFSNHRNHGHFLTCSGDFLGLVAEVMGREDGVCRGVGGSQHLATTGFHSNGVQAGLTAIAVGQALHRKRRGDPGITAVFIGDGTLGEGLLYESLNLAAIWNLPVLFVVENNGIAQSTPTVPMIGGGGILARGEAFGLHTRRFDDTDAGFFVDVERLVADVRRSGRPAFAVIDTARLGPHSKGDDTRDAAEMAALRARDPLARLGERLAPSDRARIERANEEFLACVREAACASPAARYRSRPQHIFTRPAPEPSDGGERSCAGVTVRESLQASLRQLLSGDPRVMLLGEDLADPYGGAFKVTAGLSTAFPDRVLSTPISEAAMVGAGIGLALAGSRPIVEIMFADFLTLATDQLVNHAVKFAEMFPGTTVPLVIRTAAGGRRGYGPTHSQSLEGLAAAMPGLTVVVPSPRHHPGLLLDRAVRAWPYPTVIFEHKVLYGAICDTRRYEEAPADARDPGAALFPTMVTGSDCPDITLVTYGAMVPAVEAVALRLEEEELAVRVVIVSLVAPLARHTLAGLLLRTGTRIVSIEEASPAYGFGAELGATLLERGYAGRFLRIGTPPVPIPAARSLEAGLIPDEQSIFDTVCTLFDAA